MQTINVVQLKQMVTSREAARLHFVIEPVVVGKADYWMMRVIANEEASYAWRMVSVKRAQVRTWRQINAAVRFISDQCGDEHFIEVALKPPQH